MIPDDFDPYHELQLARHAEQAVVKAVFRALADLRHPDREGGSDDGMARLNRAHEILTDPAQKAAYDLRTAGWTTFGSEPDPTPEPEPDPVYDPMNPPGAGISHAAVITAWVTIWSFTALAALLLGIAHFTIPNWRVALPICYAVAAVPLGIRLVIRAWRWAGATRLGGIWIGDFGSWHPVSILSVEVLGLLAGIVVGIVAQPIFLVASVGYLISAGRLAFEVPAGWLRGRVRA